MAEMSRDDFLACMIAELSIMKESTGLDAPRSCTLEEVLQKLLYDFPMVDEGQIEQITEYLLTLKQENKFELPKKQFINDKFIENISYLSRSLSYSNFTSLPKLCGAFYVSLPFSCLYMSAKYLNKIFPSPKVDKTDSKSMSVVNKVYDNAFDNIMLLTMTATPSILLSSNGNEDTELESTANDLSNLLCAILDMVLLRNSTTTMPNKFAEDSLLGYLHEQCLRATVNNDECEYIITKILDAVSHLMHLIRDIITISPRLYDALMREPLKTILAASSVVQEPAQKLSFIEKDSWNEVVLRQIHMLLFNTLSHIADSIHDKFTTSLRSDDSTQNIDTYPYINFVVSLRENLRGIMTLVENITNCLGNSTEYRLYVKAMENLIESLARIGLLLLESFYNCNNFRFSTPCSIEEIFLSSQFLPYLVRTAFNPIPKSINMDEEQISDSTTPIYKTLSCSTRVKYVTLLMGLSLLSTANGGKPFFAFIFRTAFPDIHNAESHLFSNSDLIISDLRRVNFGHVLFLPAFVACMFSGISSESPAQVNKKKQNNAVSMNYCEQFQVLLLKLTSQFELLNEHCGSEEVLFEQEENSVVISNSCKCTKEILDNQTLLNELLTETNEMLWTIHCTHPFNTVLFPAASSPLKSLISSLSKAIGNKKIASGCPFIVKSCAGGDTFVASDQSNGNISDCKLQQDRESVNMQLWRKIYDDRRRLVYNALKILKKLGATSAGIADTKTD